MIRNSHSYNAQKIRIPHLKPGPVLTILLVIMSSYPPLSTDMYLPALPSIATQFHTSMATMNLTLVLFFFFFAFSTLFWGPVSDRFGRKPSLLTGIILFTLASAGCALANNAYQLIAFRVLQAMGAGAPVTISIAIVQDLYRDDEKKKVLALLSALFMVAPVVAPVLGSLILSLLEWRVIFMLLVVLGLVSLSGGIFLPETNRHRIDRPLLKSFSGIFIVMKEPIFRGAVFVFSLPALVILGFVGGSASIFMAGFGVSPSLFSLYFAVNALFAIAGALIYVPLSKRISDLHTVWISLFITLGSGLLVLILGHRGPMLFMFCVVPATLFLAVLRPLGMDLMMSRSGHNAGAASAVINFFFIIIGSAGMVVVSLDWVSRTRVYALLMIITGVVCLIAWGLLNQSLSNEAPLVEQEAEV